MNRFHLNMFSSQSCETRNFHGERGGVSPLVLPRVAHDNRVRPEEYGLQNHPAHAGRSPRVRPGATLVEVLMALLIMAIGVTSVFTLFPISILKAIKAHQLTDAKLYESAIKDTLLTHSQLWTGAPEWSENTVYGRIPGTAPIQDRWVAPQRTERLVPDTNQLFACGVNSPAGFVSGAVQPNFQIRQDWSVDLVATNPLALGGYQNFYGLPTTSAAPVWMTPTYDSGLTWFPYRHSPELTDPSRSAYVVDPLGWYSRDATSPDRYVFGRIISGDATSAADTVNIDRIHCQFSSDAANALFQLPDTWNMVIETTPIVGSIPSAGRIQLVFPDTMDVRQSGSLGRVRIVLSSTLSTRTVSLVAQPTSTSVVSNPGGNHTIEFDGVLPAGFTPDQARIEVQAPNRYTWLMAVHSSPTGRFESQCAVVFNRSFEALDEQGYRAEFAEQVDVNGDGTIGANEYNVAKIRWLYSPDTDPPRIKEGGYIFDASHGYWYQIKKVEKINDEEQQRVNAADALDANGAFVRTIVTLNDSVKASSATPFAPLTFTDYQTFSSISAANSQVDCRAVLMPNVIHVFSMTPESPL